MAREIVLDTETTGFEPHLGHRLVELAALEIEDFLPTGRSFHVYIDPERDMPPGAERVHGLSAAEAQGSSETGVDTAPRRLSPQVMVAPFDPAVGAALAGAGTTPGMPTYLDSSLTVRLGHDSVAARRQDALGSIFWHALRRDEPRTQILVPPTTWNLYAPEEYGFYGNVNPHHDHPRWSQATEQRIGESGRRPTLMFNGYADEVARLYTGLDLDVHF